MREVRNVKKQIFVVFVHVRFHKNHSNNNNTRCEKFMVVFLLDFNFAAFSWWNTKHEKVVLKSQTEDEKVSERRMALSRKDSLN